MAALVVYTFLKRQQNKVSLKFFIYLLKVLVCDTSFSEEIL